MQRSTVTQPLVFYYAAAGSFAGSSASGRNSTVVTKFLRRCGFQILEVSDDGKFLRTQKNLLRRSSMLLTTVDRPPRICGDEKRAETKLCGLLSGQQARHFLRRGFISRIVPRRSSSKAQQSKRSFFNSPL